jgi:asparagine synthase (glutamine-hydrolysing)
VCGFFGVVNFKSKLKSEDINDIKKGIKNTEYRGPDDQKILSENNFCFGFNRLSIIDIEAENQPYYTSDKSIVMMCNGEIYNYQELKKTLLFKGYKFKTKTDVEVILHGYIEWGEGLWNRLNGIFSIAILDRKKNKLFLVRDHLGVKPLHYFIKGEKIYFGSDYNSFLNIHNHNHSLNNSALSSYLSFRYVIGKHTFYKNIFDILPGTLIAYDGEKTIENQYWDIPTEIEQDQGIKYYLNGLDQLIDNSVKKQMISDVPLGAFISGGLDSSLLLSYIKKYKSNINTYITGFEEHGYNEFKYAETVVDYLNLNQPKKLEIKQNEYINAIEETIRYRGEPISVPHETAFLKMSKFMKKDISVVMSGEGADEMFAGYGRIFRSPHDYYMSKKPLMGKLINYSTGDELKKKFSNPMDHFLSRYSWFTNKEKKEFLRKGVLKNNYDEYSMEYIQSLFNKISHLNYYEGMYYLLGKLHLTNLLNRLDRMTMASSVEARVPFLDVNLVEFASKIPTKYKLKWKNKFSKIISIFCNSEKISEKYDIPKYILKRLAENKLPNSIIYRKKMGFPVPLNSWANKKFGGYAYEVLTSSKSKTKELFNVSFIEKFLKKNSYNAKEDLDGKKVWMLLNIELWLQDKKL